jgi:hypothetical protein
VKLRGLIWLAVGAIVFALPYVGGPVFVIRGTQVSWGLVAMGLGAAFLIYDLVTRKKE